MEGMPKSEINGKIQANKDLKTTKKADIQAQTVMAETHRFQINLVDNSLRPHS